MGVDLDSIGGIGIETTKEELIKNLKLKFEEDDECVEDCLYHYGSDIVSLEYGGGYYQGEHSYFIIIKDLFKYGQKNIQKRINEFIEWLELHDFSSDLNVINFAYYW